MSLPKNAFYCILMGYSAAESRICHPPIYHAAKKWKPGDWWYPPPVMVQNFGDCLALSTSRTPFKRPSVHLLCQIVYISGNNIFHWGIWNGFEMSENR